MRGVTTGNAELVGAARGGWILGHFVDEEPSRRHRDVEVSWCPHHKGACNQHGAVANRAAHTLTILIYGRFRLTFASDGKVGSVLLSAPGDFALWVPGVAHDWLAEEETLLVSVRWPSIPRDQYPIPNRGASSAGE